MDKIGVNQIKALFEAGLHLGHKKNRLHPKAKRFVYKVESGVSIIDLTMTVTQLDEAKSFLKKCAEEEKTLLVVATKKVASQFTKDLCKQHNISFITNKWLPGLLTNFETIIKNVKKLKELKEQKESGEWEKLVKHERVALNKHIVKLEKFYDGLINLTKKPDVIFILDIKKEKNAAIEAQKTHIPVIAVTDTNSDPSQVEYPIVANDDSPLSVQFLVSEIITAYTGNQPKAQK